MAMNKERKRALIMTILVCIIILLPLLTLSGYNMQVVDLKYNFNYAQIRMPDGSCVEGKVQSWLDYEDSDVVQLKIDDVTYLTHYTNVVLMNK